MIVLLRGAPGSGRLDVARAVAGLYDWSATIEYSDPTHRALICGTDGRRVWIPGLVLSEAVLYDRALLHHSWGADCVLCVGDDERRERLMRGTGLDVRCAILRGRDDRIGSRSQKDAVSEMARWLGVKK